MVINHAHLGERIEAALGNGCDFGLRIRYSPEPIGALETAGGIASALPLLGEEPFLVVNGDVWCDWDFAQAHRIAGTLDQGGAHLLLVGNPEHHPGGDFCLDGQIVRAATSQNGDALTYAGIGVFWPEFFATVTPGVKMKLRPLLDAAIAGGMVSGERHVGRWVDVGTIERLAELDRELAPAL